MSESKSHNWKLHEWQDVFLHAYEHKDMQMDEYSMWLQVLEDVSDVAEMMREDNWRGARKGLAHAFCWLTSYTSNFASSNLDEVVWHKYPGVCPHCATLESEPWQRHSVPCPPKVPHGEDKHKDPQYDPERKAILDVFRTKREEMPKSLDDWADKLERLYPHGEDNIRNMGFHLVEEIGEVSSSLRIRSTLGRALTLKSREADPALVEDLRIWADYQVRSEVADVFSWITAVDNRIKKRMRAHGVKMPPRFSKVIRTVYKIKDGFAICPTCRAQRCECDPILYVSKRKIPDPLKAELLALLGLTS